MAVKTASCPLCKSAGGAKVKGQVCLSGCTNKKCRKWIDGDESFVSTTLSGAIEEWNKWREEELAAQKEAEECERMEAELEAQGGYEMPPEDAGGDDGGDGGKEAGEEAAETTGTNETAGTKEADEAEEAGGEGAAEEASGKRGYSFITDEEVEQWVRWRAEGMSVNKIAQKAQRSYRMVSDRLKAHDAASGEDGEVPQETDGGGEDEKEEPEEMKENEEPEAAEEDGETFAQFELVLDGVRYIMVPDEDGCDGCAFCMAFGKRQVCAAESSEDFKAARVLCGELEGQWREAEEE